MSKKFNKFEMINERGQVLIGKFSDFLIEEYNIVTINDQINTYKDGVYVPGDKVIEQAMLNYFPEIRQSQRREILAQIILKAKECNNVNKYLNLIAFRNGVYNTVTKELQPFSKEYIVPNKIDWDYNPEAYSKDVDTLLNKVSCYDPEIRAIMEELIGYVMYRSLEKQVAFVLIGEGSNGKSAYTKLIRELIGDTNYSSVELPHFSTDKFAAAELFGKLANIGDDISGEYISDPSMFKSLASGETVRAQRKFGQPFDFYPYATQIYTSNHIPRVKDADGGVRRRMKIIPFLNQFKPTDPDFDPGIANRIIYGCSECSAETSMSYLINLGLAGLQRILATNFTTSQKCVEASSDYDKECNPTLEWAEEYLEKNISFDMRIREDVYDDYKMWAERTGQKALSQNRFVRFINERYDTKVEPVYHAELGKTIRTFLVK